MKRARSNMLFLPSANNLKVVPGFLPKKSYAGGSSVKVELVFEQLLGVGKKSFRFCLLSHED